jgi:hypothetical protein
MRVKIIIICSLLPFLIYSQDFNHISAGRLFYNSSFAGASVYPNISLDYQGENIGDYIYGLFNCSYDQYIRKIKSGIGFNVCDIWLKDNFYGYSYSLLSYDVIFSPSIKLANRIMIKPSIYFGSNLEKYKGMGYPYQFPPPDKYNEVGSGLLVFTKDVYAGISFRNINRPEINNAPLPVEMIVNVGGVIGRSRYLGSKAILMMPFFVHDEVSELNLKQNKFGIDSRIHSLLLGTHLSLYNKGANYFSVLIGYNNRHLKTSYSFEFPISKTAYNEGGMHEISLAWTFGLKNNTTGVIALPEMGF